MPEKENTPKNPNLFLRFSGAALQMAVVIVAGVYLGKYLDGTQEGESKVFTVIFSLVGVLVAMFLIIREVMNLSKRED